DGLLLVLGRRQRLRRALVGLRIGDASRFLRLGSCRRRASGGRRVDSLLLVLGRRQVLRRALGGLRVGDALLFLRLALAGVGGARRHALHFLLLRLVLRRFAGNRALRGN